MPRKPAVGTRDRILDNACRLFADHGVRAVGLQQIIDETGCGKNLLYREFANKDELVLAWLTRTQEDWRVSTDELIAAYPDDPVAQMMALVRNTVDDVSCPDYRGCCSRNTYAEFPDPDHPAHRLAALHVEEVRARLVALAKDAGARDPESLGNRLMLIVDGIVTNGMVFGGEGAASEAVAFAEDVIKAALQPA